MLLYTRMRRSAASVDGDHSGAGGFCRGPRLLVAGFAAAARGPGSRLPLHSARRRSISLLRARRGRWEPAAWLLALSLAAASSFVVAFHGSHAPAGLDRRLKLCSALSMLLVVFDEARARTRRLLAMQAITESIAGAQQYGNVVQRAVEELQRVTRVRAAWFRLIESGHLVPTHAAGLSADFLRDAGFAEITEERSKIWNIPDAQVSNRERRRSRIPECSGSRKNPPGSHGAGAWATRRRLEC